MNMHYRMHPWYSKIRRKKLDGCKIGREKISLRQRHETENAGSRMSKPNQSDEWIGDKSLFEKYVQLAMLRAQFEQIEDGTWFGSIPGFQGVWADRKTLEDCRRELKEVLEGWLIYSARHNLEVPEVDGIVLFHTRDVA